MEGIADAGFNVPPEWDFDQNSSAIWRYFAAWTGILGVLTLIPAGACLIMSLFSKNRREVLANTMSFFVALFLLTIYAFVAWWITRSLVGHVIESRNTSYWILVIAGFSILTGPPAFQSLDYAMPERIFMYVMGILVGGATLFIVTMIPVAPSALDIKTIFLWIGCGWLGASLVEFSPLNSIVGSCGGVFGGYLTLKQNYDTTWLVPILKLDEFWLFFPDTWLIAIAEFVPVIAIGWGLALLFRQLSFLFEEWNWIV